MIRQIAARYLPDLDKTMREIVSQSLPQDANLDLLLRYAMGWVDEHDTPYHESTGKRLRPMLLFMVNEAAGGDWRTSLPAAAAIEFVHNFSLIHDDIEDNSPIRHSRPSVWKLWGIPQTINAGDAMFALAYTALENLEDLPAERQLKVLQIFNRTMMELTRGQHLDMHFETQKSISVEDYLSMIAGKTAALLAASAQIGAIIAQDNDTIAEHYANFALNLGIAFQIHDDILGIWGDPEITGKSAATDIFARKKSLPVLYGLANSAELGTIYENTNITKKEVSRAVEILDNLEAQTYARNQEKKYYEAARTSLAAAKPQGEAAEFIYAFMGFLFERNY